MSTLEEHIAEAQRELALRRACYPAWVTHGKLDAGEATYQLLGQQEIVRTLMRLDAEHRQLPWFGTGAGGLL
jgi:hypothetical protein